MKAQHNPWSHRLHGNQNARGVPLEGVPQIADDLANAFAEEDVRLLSGAQIAKFKAQIAAAKAELRRRHLKRLDILNVDA